MVVIRMMIDRAMLSAMKTSITSGGTGTSSTIIIATKLMGTM